MENKHMMSPSKQAYDFSFPAITGFLLLWLLLFAFLDPRLVGILTIASVLLTCHGLQAGFPDRTIWRAPFWITAVLYVAGTAMASWNYWELYSLYHIRLAKVIGETGIEAFMREHHIVFPVPHTAGDYGMSMIWTSGGLALVALFIAVCRRGPRSALTVARGWLRSPVGRPAWWICRGLTLFLGTLFVQVSYSLAAGIAGGAREMLDSTDTPNSDERLFHESHEEYRWRENISGCWRDENGFRESNGPFGDRKNPAKEPFCR